MAKAYDIISWPYFCFVLRMMGFEKTFIDMVWKTMANNLYSIIINGRRIGFFQSYRGLKREDPLSPDLFILGVEMYSGNLNGIHNLQGYHGFFIERRAPQVNHLSFADDTILFTS